MAKMNRHEKTAREILGDPAPEDQDQVTAATLMVASLEVGSRLGKLLEATGLSRSRAHRFWRRLRDNNVFTAQGLVDGSEWIDEETGTIGFIADVMVGCGLMVRS